MTDDHPDEDAPRDEDRPDAGIASTVPGFEVDAPDRDEAATTTDSTGESPGGRNAGTGDDEDDRDRSDPGDDEPLGALANEIRSRRTTPKDDDLFESVEVSDLDTEAVWESLSSPDDTDQTLGASVDPSRVDAGVAGDEYVVPKSDFCQRCEYLSAPPEVVCEHESAAIVEVVDSERFRVRNCPFVTEDVLE